MEKTNKIALPITPIKEVDLEVVTSTPLLRSEIGRKLIRKQFISNFPKDISISLLEMQIDNLKIEVASPKSTSVKPFIFTKEKDSDTPKHIFHPPQTISPETIEKFNQLFEDNETSKVMRKRIRL